MTLERAPQRGVGFSRGIERGQERLEILGTELDRFMLAHDALSRDDGLRQDELGQVEMGIPRRFVEQPAGVGIAADMQTIGFGEMCAHRQDSRTFACVDCVPIVGLLQTPLLKLSAVDKLDQPTTELTALDFDLFTATPEQKAQALWRFEMRDRDQPTVTLGNVLQLNLIELRKADRLGLGSGPLSGWVTFFEHWRDLMAIVHTFSCRLYGMRKYKQSIKEDFANLPLHPPKALCE